MRARCPVRLSTFEIVVASSNNAAVENITKELPALKAIGEEWQETAGYFRAQATAFLNQPDGNDRSGKKKPKKAPAQAWGLLAVPLGNAGNRRRFNDWFRWDRDGMYQHLTRLALDKPPAQDWAGAKECFTDALARERELAAERAATYRACFDPVDDAALDDAQEAARDAETALRRAQVAHWGLRRRFEEIKNQHAALNEKARAHDEAKPGRAVRLLAREHVRQWREEADALATEGDKLEASVRAVRAKVRAAGAAVTEAAAEATESRERSGELDRRRREDAKRREDARRDWLHAYPDTWPQDTRGPGASRTLVRRGMDAGKNRGLPGRSRPAPRLHRGQRPRGPRHARRTVQASHPRSRPDHGKGSGARRLADPVPPHPRAVHHVRVDRPDVRPPR